MRKVTVIFASLQKRVTLEGNYSNLSDIIDELTDLGYNVNSSNFIERYSRKRYNHEENLPETVVDREGKETTDLIFSVTNNEKFENGSISRAEVYKLIKKHNLQEEVKATYGKNFTQVSTEDLLNLLNKEDRAVPTTKEEVATPLLEKRVNSLEQRVTLLENKLDDIEFSLFPEG